MTAGQKGLPPLADLLDNSQAAIDTTLATAQKQKLEQSLAEFGLEIKVGDVRPGPTLTQFGLKLGPDVKISQIKQLDQDLSLALGGWPVSIEAPTANYPYLRLLIPNPQSTPVKLGQVLASPVFERYQGRLKVGLGLDSFTRPVVIDLADLPHLLIGGMTGSGKSTCLNAMLASLLCSYPPETLQLALVDPLGVELAAYQGLPHLFAPVARRLRPVIELLDGLSSAIDRRFTGFSKVAVRDIATYNERMHQTGQPRLPYLLILVDNVTDLVMQAAAEIEPRLTRIAALGRGAGVHLVIATQRSNVDVISGTLKANATARIAFKVTSSADSRLILDAPGAEDLFGPGDMLYKAPGSGQLHRIQGTLPSEAELNRLIHFWRAQ